MKLYIIIALALVIFLCWYFKKRGCRVGIVLLTKDPVEFNVWLDYHKRIGISKIYARLEDTQKTIIPKKHESFVDVELAAGVDLSNNYTTLQHRQREFVNKMLARAKKDGINYLIHMDDDELFYIDKQFENVEALFSTFPRYCNDIHFENMEARYVPGNSGFNTDLFRRCRLGGCHSYANGKSAAKCGGGVKFLGPHRFSGPSYQVPYTAACVLHFESGNFNRWILKFEMLSKMDEKTNKSIPFPFYHESLEAIKSKTGRLQFWKKYKENISNTLLFQR